MSLLIISIDYNNMNENIIYIISRHVERRLVLVDELTHDYQRERICSLKSKSYPPVLVPAIMSKYSQGRGVVARSHSFLILSSIF